MLASNLCWPSASSNPDPLLSVSAMRPDEHKQKRSAQYKKKHGIAGKNEGAKKGENSTECVKSRQGLREDEASVSAVKNEVKLHSFCINPAQWDFGSSGVVSNVCFWLRSVASGHRLLTVCPWTWPVPVCLSVCWRLILLETLKVQEWEAMLSILVMYKVNSVNCRFLELFCAI